MTLTARSLSLCAVFLLIVSTAAVPAQDQSSTGEPADVAPDAAAEIQQATADTDPEPEQGDDEEPTEDAEQAPEEDLTEVGPVEMKVANPNNVLQQLDESAGERAALFPYGPISFLYPPWQALNEKLDDEIGLRLGLTYYILFQYTTPGPDPREAASGDFDFFGRWKLIGEEGGNRGILGFNLEHRHKYTSIPPSELNVGIGSIWRTTRGFTDSGFSFNELWWDQRLANDQVRIRFGTINPKHFYDLHRFKSQKRFFQSTPLSDSPTIDFPRNGLGAVIRLSPLKELHIAAGINDANGDRSVGGFDTFFGDAEFFPALNVAYTPTFEGLGEGRYSVTLWHIDARSNQGTPSGRGISALIEQEVIDGVVPFVRYGYGDGADLAVEHLVALGVGLDRPFGRKDDRFGVGGSWARPSGGLGRDQWGFEAFYRFQVTPVFQVSPGAQLIVNPSLNPDDDVIGVFQLRLGFVF
ncbi:MAG: carbohydrate porin [Thermoanaerobaculia bacterium]